MGNALNSAHFVAYKGFRERLHGHNYTVELRLGAPVGEDGYVVDFGILKKVLRSICKELNEYLLVPEKSDVLDITTDEKSVFINAADGAEFKIPKTDCKMLPLVHSTAEELAVHITNRLVDEIGSILNDRQVKWTEVVVAERPTQEARYFRKYNASN